MFIHTTQSRDFMGRHRYSNSRSSLKQLILNIFLFALHIGLHENHLPNTLGNNLMALHFHCAAHRRSGHMTFAFKSNLPTAPLSSLSVNFNVRP